MAGIVHGMLALPSISYLEHVIFKPFITLSYTSPDWHFSSGRLKSQPRERP